MKSVEEIIQQKAYNQLTSEELVLVSELVDSELDYNEMKQFLSAVESISVSEVVNPEIKSSLNQIFQSKHSGIQQNWKAPAIEKAQIIPIYKRTWFQVAALLLLFVGVLAIWLPNSTHFNTPEATVVAENKNMGEEKSTSKKSNEETAPVMNDAVHLTDSNASNGAHQATQSRVSEDQVTVQEELMHGYFTQGRASQPSEAELSAANPIIAGINADLNPERMSYRSSKEVSKSELLSLIEPSF